MMSLVARSTLRFTYVLVGILLILLALLTVTARVGLPLLASHKSNIEARISDYLQSPVDIGELSLRWEGFGPSLLASDVSVIESSGRAVSVDEILLDINLVKSLSQRAPVVNELSLVGADLVIESDSNGHFSLHGIKPVARSAASVEDSNAGNGVDVMGWLFNARKVALLDTRVTLTESDNDQHVMIDNLNVIAENDGNVHQLRVDASLPAAVGGSLSAGIDLIGESDKLSSSDGTVQLTVNDVSWHGLNEILSESGLPSIHTLVGESAAGIDATAQLDLWGKWENGELIFAQAPLSFSDIADRTGQRDFIDNAAAQLAFTRTDQSTELVVSDVKVSHESEELLFDEIRLTKHDEPSTFALSDVSPEAQSSESALTEKLPSEQGALADSFARFLGNLANHQLPWQLSATAEQLPIDIILHIVSSGYLPSSHALADTLIGAVAAGRFENVQIAVKDIDVQSKSATDIKASADINSLAFADLHNTLAFGPVNGKFTFQDTAGELQIKATDMPLIATLLTNEALNVDVVSAATTIDVSDLQKVRIASDVRLVDDGIDSNTRINATFSAGQSPHLDIQSEFSADNLQAVKQWIPRNQISEVTSSWIDRSIKSGRASQGSLLFFGHAADFPFNDSEGVFKLNVNVEDGVLAFLPSWPEIRNINGTFVLDGLSLTGEANNSVYDQFTLSTTRVGISNIAAPVLTIISTGSGAFNDVVQFSVDGPLSAILEPVVNDMSGTGATEMDLEMVVPLYSKPADGAVGLLTRTWRPFSFNGSLFLNDNDVTFGRADLTLRGARGAVGFNRQGIAISALRGQVLDHDVRITGKTEGVGENATSIINVTGAMEANDILAHYGNTLDQFVSGTSQWNITLSAPHSERRVASEGVRLSASSDLLGTSLLLPKPFDKSSAREKQFALETAFKGDGEEQQWSVSYGDELRSYVSIKDQSLYSMLIELGSARFAERANLLNQPGVRIDGDTPTLAADDWILTLSRYIDSLPESESGPQPILPITGGVSTNAMILGNTNFGKASFRTDTDDTYLELIVTNQSLVGNVRYPRAHWRKDLAMQARIESLDWSIFDALSDDESEEFSSASDDGLDPRLLPPVEVRVASLTKDDLRVQDLVLRAEPDVSGLDITTLGFAYDTMRLVGQGYWHLRDPQGVNPSLAGKHSTQLNMVLQSNDFGAGLTQLGLDDVLDEGRGSIDIKIGWPAPLYLPEIADFDGAIAVELRSGSIIPLEPEAARVVGLFAFQALQRRLELDFTDLTGEGLAFERIVGNIDIKRGVAHVPLLQLTGPIGVVDIVGTSDLAEQQFDQEVTILPRVSAALPIIGAISGGASGGIGALVATGFLKALGVDFDRIGLRTFSLTGDWSSPQLESIPSEFLRLTQ